MTVALETDEVIFTLVDHVATATLNRPERRNPVTDKMPDELGEVIGPELPHAERASAPATKGARILAPRRHLLVDMALVVAEGARFGLPEVPRGLVAKAGGLLRLPRRTPFHVAMEWALTGEPVAAGDAARYGLVNRVVSPGSTVDASVGRADTVAGNAPSRHGGVEAHRRRGTGPEPSLRIPRAGGDQQVHTRVGGCAPGRPVLRREEDAAMARSLTGGGRESRSAP